MRSPSDANPSKPARIPRSPSCWSTSQGVFGRGSESPWVLDVLDVFLRCTHLGIVPWRRSQSDRTSQTQTRRLTKPGSASEKSPFFFFLVLSAQVQMLADAQTTANQFRPMDKVVEKVGFWGLIGLIAGAPPPLLHRGPRAQIRVPPGRTWRLTLHAGDDR
jgi:hypothetical protein